MFSVILCLLLHLDRLPLAKTLHLFLMTFNFFSQPLFTSMTHYRINSRMHDVLLWACLHALHTRACSFVLTGPFGLFKFLNCPYISCAPTSGSLPNVHSLGLDLRQKSSFLSHAFLAQIGVTRSRTGDSHANSVTVAGRALLFDFYLSESASFSQGKGNSGLNGSWGFSFLFIVSCARWSFGWENSGDFPWGGGGGTVVESGRIADEN